VKLITDRMTGRFRGFAFVEMAEASDAQKAVEEFNVRTVAQRQIKVAEARPKRSRSDRDSWGGGGRRRC
jgi:cold-inducible RNA-binding protein